MIVWLRVGNGSNHLREWFALLLPDVVREIEYRPAVCRGLLTGTGSTENFANSDSRYPVSAGHSQWLLCEKLEPTVSVSAWWRLK